MIYELTLRKEDGSTIVHTKDFIKSKELLNALKLNKKEFQDDEEQLLALTDYVANVFGIATDDILEGVDAHDLETTLLDIFYKILGYGEKKRVKLLQLIKQGEIVEDEE